MKFGYTSKEACKVAVITYRQLHYWDKTNLVKPSIAAATGTGSRRIYSFVDLVCLRVTSRLKKEGTSLQKIRRSVAYLAKNFPEDDRPMANVVFLTDGESIFVLTEDPNILLDTLHDGQFVLSVAVGQLAEDTKARIVSMERKEESEGHVFEVVIEPDRNVYLAYCPILPGCITWGETKAQAYQYIKDAVRLYLEDMIEEKEPIPGIGIVESINDLKPVIRVKKPEEAVA